jgi:hypothetical protein
MIFRKIQTIQRMQVFSLYNHLKINKLSHKTVKILRGCIEIKKNQKPFEQHTQKAFFRKNTEGVRTVFSPKRFFL